MLQFRQQLLQWDGKWRKTGTGRDSIFAHLASSWQLLVSLRASFNSSPALNEEEMVIKRRQVRCKTLLLFLNDFPQK